MKCVVSGCKNCTGKLSKHTDGVTFHLNTTDTKSRQVTNVSSPRAAPQLPVKVSRTRSNSTSIATTLVSPPARKRTSSGVFQVDESEPVPKKIELTRSHSDSSRKKTEVHANGSPTTDKEQSKKKSETNENSESDVEKSETNVGNSESDVEKSEICDEENKPTVIEKFDSEAKSQCVAAFKESESWE